MLMIRWNVRERAQARGWTNPQQLATATGLTYPLAARIWEAKPLQRIDVATLERLTTVFGLKTPWPLLDYDPKD
jgi:transcriptional regulator with XRE-family HTH domain